MHKNKAGLCVFYRSSMPATPLHHRSPAMTPTGYRTPRSGYASPSGYQTPSGGYGTPSVSSCNYSRYTNRNYLSLPTGDRLAQSACSSRRASVCRDTMYINEDPYKDLKSVSGELLNIMHQQQCSQPNKSCSIRKKWQATEIIQVHTGLPKNDVTLVSY